MFINTLNFDITKLIERCSNKSASSEEILKIRTMLEVVVADRESRIWYIRRLKEMFQGNFTEFHALPDETVRKVLEKRFSELSYKDLLEIAINPTAISQLSFEVSEESPDVWKEIYELIGIFIATTEKVQLSDIAINVLTHYDIQIPASGFSESGKPVRDDELLPQEDFAMALGATARSSGAERSIVTREISDEGKWVLMCDIQNLGLVSRFPEKPMLSISWKTPNSLNVSISPDRNEASMLQLTENAKWHIIWGDAFLSLDTPISSHRLDESVRAFAEQDFPMQDELSLESVQVREKGDRLLLWYSSEGSTEAGYILKAIIDFDSFQADLDD